MTLPLTFVQTYPGGRILLMLGKHEVGAVFPPPHKTTMTRPDWRWSWWLCGYMACKEGRANTELAAKHAILAKAQDWLRDAGVQQ